MLARPPLRDDEVLTFEDTYIIEMAQRVSRLRDIASRLDETAGPRRWLENLSLSAVTNDFRSRTPPKTPPPAISQPIFQSCGQFLRLSRARFSRMRNREPAE